MKIAPEPQPEDSTSAYQPKLPPVSALNGPEPIDEFGLPLGRRLGPYEIRGHIASGGMGSVYRAVRVEDYGQQVAIKFIRPGLDREETLRRFGNERQILANLRHPNIARLLDGGTDDEGRPYLVMEYIEGEPIDRYCDARLLTTAKRLALFRLACSAVQYAHQNTIIHRDLKPSNILVTADGVPKLLDFGLAKLVDPNSAHDPGLTQPDQRPMTPAYASPEQVRGEVLTTATDLYSLGAVLYELLTGRRPYSERDRRALDQAICEREPEKPSVAAAKGGSDDPSRTREGRRGLLKRHLEGDVDTIVMKALRKEPDRRYATVDQFSEDISRHLDGLPILARRDARGYVASRFIRRHRVALATAALVFASLVGGIIVAALALRNEQIALGKEQFALKESEKNLKAVRASEHQLRLQSARLASQRGQWRVAADHYRRAIEDRVGDEAPLRVGLIEALTAINDRGGANREYLLLPTDLGKQAGAVLLLRGDRAMSETGKSAGAIDQVKKAIASGSLSPADKAYASALLAPTPTQAIGHLKTALATDQFHHRSHNMLLLMYVFTGRHEALAEQARIVETLFPEDPVPKVSLAFSAAFRSDAAESTNHLADALRLGQIDPGQSEGLRTLISIILDVSKTIEASDAFTAIRSILGKAPALNRARTLQQGEPGVGNLMFGTVNLPAFDHCYGTAMSVILDVFSSYESKIARLRKAVAEDPEDGLLSHLLASYLVNSLNRDPTNAKKTKATLIEAEEAARRAADGPLPFESIRKHSRFLVINSQALLGRTTRMGEADPVMRSRLIRRLTDELGAGSISLADIHLPLSLARQVGAFDLALAYTDHWERLSPFDDQALLTRAEIELEAGRPLRAIAGAERLIKRNPRALPAFALRQRAMDQAKQPLPAIPLVPFASPSR